MIRLVTDSSSDLPPEAVSRHGIEVVPLTVRFGDVEFVDRVELDAGRFWSELAAAERLPETAAPSVGAFLDAYDRLAAEGATGIVAICLSSVLSSTYQSAVIAAEQWAVSVPVKVVDSRAVTMALGLQVLEAAEAAAAGADIDEVANAALAATSRTNIFAALDTLEYLHRGGRIGGAQALLGSLLDVKPLITFADGAVAAAGRVRTRRKAIGAICARVSELAPRLRTLAVLHGSATDVDSFVAAVRTAAGGLEPLVAQLGPVVGTHTGPGALGVAYLLD